MDKQALRQRTWQALRAAGVARFPGAVGRIPNFTGAEAAAERLASLPIWSRAKVLKCNPDLPQRAVRARALREGKVVYVAVPRLATPRPFVRLDPARIPAHDLWRSSSIVGAFELGEPVELARLGRIDLVVCGSVAAAPDGARLGKGGGYTDLELALLREHGCLGPRTPIATTLHPLQLQRRGRIPMERHDLVLDVIVTPRRVVPCQRAFRRPGKVLAGLLTDEQRAAMPALGSAHTTG